MAVKWELDLWYEMWDRAGSQGLDIWFPIGDLTEGEGRPARESPDGANGLPVEPDGPSE